MSASHPLHGTWRYVDATMDGKSTRPNGKGMIYYAPSGAMMCQVSPGNNVAKVGAKPPGALQDVESIFAAMFLAQQDDRATMSANTHKAF